MSKTPFSSRDGAQLVTVLESSLQVEFLRGGTNASRLTEPWTAHPFTIVGQSPDGAVAMELEGRPPMRQGKGAGYILPEGVRFRSLPYDTKSRNYHWLHFRFRVLGEVDLFHFITAPGVVPPKIG